MDYVLPYAGMQLPSVPGIPPRGDALQKLKIGRHTGPSESPLLAGSEALWTHPCMHRHVTSDGKLWQHDKQKQPVAATRNLHKGCNPPGLCVLE